MLRVSLWMFLVAVCSIGLASPEPNLWAVLVAGSAEWYNYRHQADVCHAYQILKSHGVPEEQIIVMMYDDIANNTQNPTPGIIINRPNGSDVYAGVPKDYVGEDVTIANFRKVLLGESEGLTGSGKVLRSGPKDHVFINFVDHGGVDLICFPNEELFAKNLSDILSTMWARRMYGKLVLYVEACESGSMFSNLPTDMNIYSITAANAKESSYACYFDKKRGTYLGDVFSVNWMEDSGHRHNLKTETLKKQFQLVKRETNTSHVQHFGDLTMANMTVADFQGENSSPSLEPPPDPASRLDAVPSEDVPLHILRHKKRDATTKAEKRAISKELSILKKKRTLVDSVIESIVSSVAPDPEEMSIVLLQRRPVQDPECYQDLVTYYSKTCFALSKNPYALRHLRVFNNLCLDKVERALIKMAIEEACKNLPAIDGIH